MKHDFEPEKPVIHDEKELRELLARLDASKMLAEQITHHSDHTVTVEDVAEACDLDPEFVASELRKMLQEHREARLHGALKELEEPLYRVERPAVSGSDKLDPIFRLRSVQMLMDRHKEPELHRRPVVKERESKVGHYLGLVVVWLVVVWLVILCAVYLIGTGLVNNFIR